MLTTINDYDVVNSVPMTRWDGPDNSRLYLVNTMSEWKAFYELLMTQKLVACDTETSGFEYYKDDRIVGLSFGWGKTHWYIPVRHEDSLSEGEQPPQLQMDDIREDLKRFFSQEDVFTVWHNWKFDAHFYRADDIEILTPHHDTLLLWKFFDENAPGKLKVIASGWKDLLGRWHKGLIGKDAATAEKKLDRWRTEEARMRRKAFSSAVMAKADEMQTDPEYQSWGRRELKKYIAKELLHDHEYANACKDDVHYGFIPIPLMSQYAALDTYLTWRVYEYVMGNLKFSKKLQKLYINEIKLSRALLEAEGAGVRIGRDYLTQLGKQYELSIESLVQSLTSQLGDFNFNSPQQLSEALVTAGVPLVRKTDSASSCSACQAGTCALHYQTDAKVLKKLEHDYAVVKQILGLRAVEKLNGTYVQGILQKLTHDNILHCKFNQNVKTGRMSSRDPNLQNIPGRDTSIRRAFLAPEGDDWVYVFLDYSQVEVRLTAHYSQDPLLLDAYAKGQDVHTRTCCEMFGYNYDEMAPVIAADDHTHPMYKEWKQYRNIAKRINFGIIYGVGAPGLAEQIPRPTQYENLSHKQWVQVCQAYIDQYLDKYLGVKRFINEGKRTVRRFGQVENHFGRVRHLPHARATKILSDRSKYWLEARAKRQGVNFLIQGTAADLFKTAVVRVHDLLKDHKSYIVNFVHDEIQIYLHKSELHLLKEMKAQMEDFDDFTVPIVVDVEYSTTNWAEKQGI